MEIIPETEEYPWITERVEQNFEQIGLEVESPNRVVYGFTPSGGGSYMPESDTIFIGQETLKSEGFYDFVTYEHENIHYEQFRRILGDTREDYHDLVDELTDRALTTAADHFEEESIINQLTDDQHLSFYNFKMILGLASEHSEFLEEIKSLKTKYDEKRRQMVGVPKETAQKLQYRQISDRGEEIAGRYWEDISRSDCLQKFSPLMRRHDLNLRADLLEAETQLWNMLRAGSLKELPPQEGEFHADLESTFESLEIYEDNSFYENGGNVENATKNILEQFRKRKHTENTPDIQIVAEMINEGLENADEKLIEN